MPQDLAIFIATGKEPSAVSCLVRDHHIMAVAAGNVVWHRLHEAHRPPQHELVMPKFADLDTIPPAATTCIQRILPPTSP